MKTIFLTGISRGIGFAIFKLLKSSYNIIGTTRDLNSFNKKFPEKSAKDSTKIIEIDFDILTNESWNDYTERITTKLNLFDLNIDIFINNSGVAHFAPFVDLNSEIIKNEYFVNSLAPTLIIHKIVQQMVKQKKGVIINISSIATKKVFENASIYTASKNSIIGITNSLREEGRKHNIKVINVLLGATNTEIWDSDIRENSGHRMISASNVATVIQSLITLSELQDLMIEEIIIKPQFGDL